MRTILIRVRYWWKKACNLVGYCPCGNRVNWTRYGRPICPECKK